MRRDCQLSGYIYIFFVKPSVFPAPADGRRRFSIFRHHYVIALNWCMRSEASSTGMAVSVAAGENHGRGGQARCAGFLDSCFAFGPQEKSCSTDGCLFTTKGGARGDTSFYGSHYEYTCLSPTKTMAKDQTPAEEGVHCPLLATDDTNT